MSNPTVAIYIRVSTLMQADRDSLPMQRKDLVSYSELVLHAASYEVFEDAGFSAKSTDRPAYQRMMELIREKRFTHLLVWKLDRVSRNLLDFASMYEELKRLQVIFVSMNEQFDTSSAMGEAMLKIILVFAELERKITGERVTATMVSRAASGKWNGGTIPYGYSFDGESFSLNEKEAQACRLARDIYMSTHSIGKTLAKLSSLGIVTRQGGPMNGPTLHRILTSPFYRGTLVYNRHTYSQLPATKNPESEWVCVPNHHPAIFTEEEQVQTSSVLASNKHIRHTDKTHSPFQRLVQCGICGTPMYITNGRKLKNGYQSTRYFCHVMRDTHQCTNNATTDTIFGGIVINVVNTILYAKNHVHDIDSPQALSALLMRPKCFSNVSSIGGVQSLFSFLLAYTSGESYQPRAPFDAPAADTGEHLQEEISRLQRALERLQDLYLYSEDSMSKTDYLLQRESILKRIAALKGALPKSQNKEAIFFMASNIYLSSVLGKAEPIDYLSLVSAVDTDVLNDYLSHILDRIVLTMGQVTEIVFVNGLSLTIAYKKPRYFVRPDTAQ